MNNLFSLIKTISNREHFSAMGETNINSVAFQPYTLFQPQDAGSTVPVSDLVSQDSSDEWFIMGISVWGSTNRLVAD